MSMGRIVGDIHNVVDGAHTHRAQTLTHPLGGRTNLHIAHHTGTVTGTQVSIGRLHIQKLYQIALGTTLDNRDGETVPY